MKKRLFDNQTDIEKIINKCEVCYVAMTDENNMPYVLPFNFGYSNKRLYLHGTKTGRKIDILKRNNNVCVTFSTDHSLVYQNDSVACSFTMKFRSVVAFGKVVFVEDYNEKVAILNKIMTKYTGKEYNYSKPAVINVEIFYVDIEKWTGKESGY
jgi:uncharacterized protein